MFSATGPDEVGGGMADVGGCACVCEWEEEPEVFEAIEDEWARKSDSSRFRWLTCVLLVMFDKDCQPLDVQCLPTPSPSASVALQASMACYVCAACWETAPNSTRAEHFVDERTGLSH